MAGGHGVGSIVYMLLLCLPFLLYDKLLRKDSNEYERTPMANPYGVGKKWEIQYQGIYIARRAKYHRRRILSGKILDTTNCTSTFNMERKLLICGDVSSNPGPKAMHYCIECRKKVRRNKDAIICTDCDAQYIS